MAKLPVNCLGEIVASRGRAPRAVEQGIRLMGIVQFDPTLMQFKSDLKALGVRRDELRSRQHQLLEEAEKGDDRQVDLADRIRQLLGGAGAEPRPDPTAELPGSARSPRSSAPGPSSKSSCVSLALAAGRLRLTG